MSFIKERLKRKAYVNQVYNNLHTPKIRNEIAKEMYNQAIETRLLNEKKDYIYDNKLLEIPAIIIEFLFEVLIKYDIIENIKITTRDRIIHLEIERNIVPSFK